MVVIKDRSSIFLPKAVNFFWTKHCHTPVDSSPHNDVHFQDTCLNSVDYLVTYEVCTVLSVAVRVMRMVHLKIQAFGDYAVLTHK